VRLTSKTRLISISSSIIISALLIFLMLVVIDHMKRGIMEDRFSLLIQMVNTRCDEEKTVNVDELCAYIASVDSYYDVFAAVYDSGFNNLSIRHPDVTIGQTISFNPAELENALKSFKAIDSDFTILNFIVFFDTGKEAIYRTPLYLRRVTVDDDYVIVALATPFIDDLISLPRSYFIIIYIIFTVATFSSAFMIVTFTHNLFPQRQLLKKKEE